MEKKQQQKQNKNTKKQSIHFIKWGVQLKTFTK